MDEGMKKFPEALEWPKAKREKLCSHIEAETEGKTQK